MSKFTKAILILSFFWAIFTILFAVAFTFNDHYIVASGWGIGTGVWLFTWKLVRSQERRKREMVRFVNSFD